MQPCEGENLLEIGYLFKQAYWHHGYAREAADACKQYAFRRLGANAVHAIIKTDNQASIRVAEAIGLHRDKTFITRYYSGNREHYLYTAYANR